MAVSVSRDLTVQVLEDVNAAKLTDRQKALRAAIQRGEPKCLGVSQVMLGLMVLSYSIPLHLTEFTTVVVLGVPWWSSITFITAGVVAIILDKHCTMKTLLVCLVVSMASAALSVVAVIIYSVDIHKHPETSCIKSERGSCDEKHYALMSKGIKSTLLLFTLAQTAISAILCFLLNRQRRTFGQYFSLNEPSLHTPTAVTAPDLN
ncbi:transmembrane protein 176 isoform X2 [Cololabis saira]|uniref:transmembrane protein 176 isoform X2 n=1 Tax=Cololabis saira TaxID=129043 RepID=UPI002AD215EC|nr:transmembrane protein 176 isoform X2 [Cololabis saira]